MKSWIKIASNFIKKIGKQNFFIIVFILIILCITGLYQTFSLYTSSEGVSIVNGIKTYKFILSSNEENSVTIAAGSSKYLAITVTNPEKLDLKYAIYYSANSDLEEFNIGYLGSSEYPSSGIIEANQNYVINCRVTNVSDSDVTINFGIKYGFENGGTITLDSNQNYLEQFRPAYLIEAESGSYVLYIGRNGCDFESGNCGGLNPNFVSGSSMGYCWYNTVDNGIFTTTGWRLAYVKESIPYLISAGSAQCLSTSSSGVHSNTEASSYESTAGVPIHWSKMSEISLSYCNSNYAYDGTCSTDNSWTIGEEDLNGITNGTGSIENKTCVLGESNVLCGYGNDLIDNGGYYWFAVSRSDNQLHHWHPQVHYISTYYTLIPAGVRPVLKLRNDIMIVSGAGTFSNPYRITTPETRIDDLSDNGNDGINQNASWDKSNGTLTTDGLTNYADAGLKSYNFGSSVTLIAKVKFNSLDNTLDEQFIFGNWEGGGLGLLVDSGRLAFNIYVNGSYSTFYSNITPVTDVWYTLVGTYDGNNIKFYINGTEATLDTSISGATNTATGTIGVGMLFYIGGNPEVGNTILNDDNSSGVKAIFDDILIFDRAVTASEVTADYSSEVTVTDKTDLLLYYDFKE